MSKFEPEMPTDAMTPADAASYWFVRRDGRELSESEAEEFERWIAASPTHAPALAQMSAAWKFCEGIEADQNLAALRAKAIASPRRGSWKLVASGLLAASLITGVILGTPIKSVLPGDAASSGVPLAQSARYETAKGEMRTLTLADGSKVTLNTASQIHVTLAPERRVIHLVRGQALFEVAHDPDRPFVVEARNRRVTALGTVFEVRLDADRMEVALIKGRVAVDQRTGRPSRAILRPGEALLISRGVNQPIVRIDASTQLQWRDGFAEFVDAPLAQVVQEMNRYSSRAIVLKDENLAGERINGVFRTGDPERFVAIVSELVAIDSQNLPDRIILTRAKPSEPGAT